MKMRMRSCRAVRLAALGVLLGSAPLVAVDELRVNGLFRDRAVVEIDGRQRVLQAGVRSPEGVLLIESNSRRAIIEIDGVRGEYPLGDRIQTGFPPPRERVVQIVQNPDGLFVAAGHINGQPVTFHVDTGATSIALNSGLATQLGIDWRAGEPLPVNTASGTTTAWFVWLDSVDVGGIRQERVWAGVVEGTRPARPLLGMSFLTRVDLLKRENLLELRQR
jgi:aspartyl protease family protein